MRHNLVSSALRGVRVLALVIPIAAHAENKGDIRNYLIAISDLYENLEYEHALNQIRLARQMPRETEEEVTLSLYEGIILCEMGQQEQGGASFRSALLLRPDTKLPVQVAPKVEALFKRVRQQVKSKVEATRARYKPERQQSVTAQAPERIPVQTTAAPTRLTPEAVSQKPALPIEFSPHPAPSSVPRRDALHRYALIPALAGGGLAVAGGISWAISRGELNQLRTNDSKLATMDDVQRSVSRGRAWQTAGVGLLSVGAVGLATAVGMYVLGSPDQPVALGMSTNGTSAFVYGRWP